MAPASSSWMREEISGRRIPELVQLARVGNPGEGAHDFNRSSCGRNNVGEGREDAAQREKKNPSRETRCPRRRHPASSKNAPIALHDRQGILGAPTNCPTRKRRATKRQGFRTWCRVEDPRLHDAPRPNWSKSISQSFKLWVIKSGQMAALFVRSSDS